MEWMLSISHGVDLRNSQLYGAAVLVLGNN